ncbi:pentatricopeptide repeat-containing protein At5g64320, mitochondrial-like, partial [Cannabis sativa]|uniref:pentatricopeptide repeat-containing protein At5g64320, mitochondrial-like n=1 Tax=Cannabis sativa TaxID=3483 RepID=UPI0029CA2B95
FKINFFFFFFFYFYSFLSLFFLHASRLLLLLSLTPADSPSSSSSSSKPVTEINLLLPRLCLSNQLNTATHLAITALLTNPPLDAISLSALLDSLASQSDITMPMSLLTRLRRSPMFQHHVAPINNTLVAAYFRKGQLKEAIKVFNWMLRSGSPFKLVEKFCGILVDEFCRSGMVLKALKVLRAMVAADICPHGELRKVVYRGLLREARIRERWGLMGLILGARVSKMKKMMMGSWLGLEREEKSVNKEKRKKRKRKKKLIFKIFYF